METWRSTFGYAENDSPSYEGVVEKYRKQILEAPRDQDLAAKLGEAIARARSELVSQPVDNSVMIPEQLLPP